MAGLRALAQRYDNGPGFDGPSGQRIRHANAMTIDHLPALPETASDQSLRIFVAGCRNSDRNVTDRFVIACTMPR